MERISERNFVIMSEKYEKEQLEADHRLKEIDAELTAKGVSDKGVTDFFYLISRYHGITELTAATLNTLIDKITVSERKENEDGVMEQRITICYKFVGSLHEFSITVPQRQCFIEEKSCSVCGAMYLPGSNVAKYCPSCREIERKEAVRRADQRRIEKRSGKGLVPKHCLCCGITFFPKSHNARYCGTCAPEARKIAVKQWQTEYYQKQKAKREMIVS